MKKPIKLSSFILLFSLGLLVAQRQAAAQNSSLNGNKTLFDVAVVLDLGTPLGKMSEICISMALDDFYSTHNNYTSKLNLLWRDSNQDNVDAASLGMLLVPSLIHSSMLRLWLSVLLLFLFTYLFEFEIEAEIDILQI